MNEFVSRCCDDTENFGQKISQILKGTETIAMFGGMGMGKTSLVRGICDGLGLKDEVSSPTYSLVNEYITGKFPVYHFDMYRVVDFESLCSTGFFDYLENGVILIEWSENIKKFLPEKALQIFISSPDDQQTRVINFNFDLLR